MVDGVDGPSSFELGDGEDFDPLEMREERCVAKASVVEEVRSFFETLDFGRRTPYRASLSVGITAFQLYAGCGEDADVKLEETACLVVVPGKLKMKKSRPRRGDGAIPKFSSSSLLHINNNNNHKTC